MQHEAWQSESRQRDAPQSLGDETLMARVCADRLGSFEPSDAFAQLDAFEQLVERYRVGVFSLCYQMLRSREDAEEAAQDAFLKAFRARSSFEEGRRFAPWLLKIASNAARDILRRKQKRLLPSAEDFEEPADPTSAVPGDARSLEAEELRRALHSLSEGYRTPLVLKYLNGLTNREVAAAMDMSLSSLKVRLGRARELLEARLTRRGAL